jgi:50S ribosomal subunit-associated GTPase HflX
MILEKIENKKVIIAGLISYKAAISESSFYELENYIENKGGKVVGKLLQRRGVSRSKMAGGAKKLNQPLDSSTFIGKGKADELKEICNKTKSDTVVFINKLKKTQIEKLSLLTDCEVISLPEFPLPLISVSTSQNEI